MNKVLIALLVTLPLLANATNYKITLKNNSSKTLQVKLEEGICFKSNEEKVLINILTGQKVVIPFSNEDECQVKDRKIIFKVAELNNLTQATSIAFNQENVNDGYLTTFTQHFYNSNTPLSGSVFIKSVYCNTSDDPNEILSNPSSIKKCMLTNSVYPEDIPLLKATVNLDIKQPS